ncbi:ABC transporter ATP-binding protein [Psychromonas sp.]|uniref:ABC transporter ATP-binding protein n=1 Tax=Psychromonas sp. TaxID=1884585 RepID=UPI0035692025
MTGVTLKNIKKSYGKTDVLFGIDLQIELGEFVVFVGPSGCGKSTLLRMIAGLEDITDGELYIEDVLVNDIPSAMRGIAMVFQTYALYPHMTVYDNMAFAMRIAKENKAKIDERVNAAADMLQLKPYLDRLPKALSGGQRQRVAIGRAIVRNPKVFLFDEPLSNLDAALRVQTRIEIANLKETLKDTTMIYVTHDQVEAMTLADRIVVLAAGKIEQVGTPLELYTKPANLFVAKFIGSPAMNIFKADVVKTGGNTCIKTKNGHQFDIPVKSLAGLNNQEISVGVRPEDFYLSDQESCLLSGEVAFVESLGEVTLLHLAYHEKENPVVVKIPGIVNKHKGDIVYLQAEQDKVHLFDPQGISLLYL